jgi:hypothetical protein
MDAKAIKFPDQIYIDKLRTALWRGRQFGRAAVMVGSGFSLNAVPVSMSVAPFPTWNGLSGHLVEGLYTTHPGDHVAREAALTQAKSTSGALRLAEEFEAAFGRGALDMLLLTHIPDASYEPGSLHQLLLRLPWADVFTTNYDTLLERATVGLVNRKYEVVRTVAEIPNAARPRIVKLHGSFPSTRPFIITEEDFRTYPRRFASFVNLVQQSMMETCFCLLGFSGDDPNFLNWSGWVRDTLGASCPQIYLCGIFDLTPARKHLLHSRNVVPIDLSPMFPEAIWTDPGVRHARAIEWFLLSLEAGQPPSPLNWPSPTSPRRTPRSAGLPEITEPHFPQPARENL